MVIYHIRRNRPANHEITRLPETAPSVPTIAIPVDGAFEITQPVDIAVTVRGKVRKVTASSTPETVITGAKLKEIELSLFSLLILEREVYPRVRI